MNQIVQGVYCDTRKAKQITKYAIKKSYMPPCGYEKKWKHWVRIYRTKNGEYFMLEKSCCTDETISIISHDKAKELIMMYGTGKECIKFMKKYGIHEEIQHLGKRGMKMDWISVNNRLPESNKDWISVNNRLPESNKNVLARTECATYVFVGAYDVECKTWFDANDNAFLDKLLDSGMRRVSHWMPLPEPPKEGECKR